MSLRTRNEGYSGPAKTLHWIVAAMVLLQVPIGITMVNIASGALQNSLYDWHKLIGFVLLWVVLIRLGRRLIYGVPPDEPTIEPWQKVVSHIVHWTLYALLIVLPILGWIGVSAYPARGIFGGAINLPEIVSPDRAFSERILGIHKALALVATVLVLLHIAAAFFHFLIRRDGVMQRMLPGRHAQPSVIRR